MPDVYLNNVRRESWNDATRIVTFYDAAGAQTSQRAYTAAEIADADARALVATSAANRSAVQAQAVTAITEITASVEALKVIYGKANGSIGPADTKDVAREARRIGRQTIRLSRLLLSVLDSASSGTAE